MLQEAQTRASLYVPWRPNLLPAPARLMTGDCSRPSPCPAPLNTAPRTQALAAATSSECNACSRAAGGAAQTTGAAGASPSPAAGTTATGAGAGAATTTTTSPAPAGGASALAAPEAPPGCRGTVLRDCCQRGPSEAYCRCAGGYCRFVRVGASPSVWRNQATGEQCSC